MIQQCRAKIKALKKRYREIVDKLRKSGTGRESDGDDNFPFFSDFHAVMGGRATVSPIHLLDSASSSTQLQGGQQDEDNDVNRFESLECLFCRSLSQTSPKCTNIHTVVADTAIFALLIMTSLASLTTKAKSPM